jgi:hypothetical protein
MAELVKYPPTLHLEGSGLQRGDSHERVAFSQLAGRTLAIETKLDGSNTAISFDEQGELRLQSRGDWLLGGDKSHFDQFKTWAAAHAWQLRELLADRYVMYGEWMAAKHSVYYDLLPHLFLEFDILDRSTGEFLDTPSRHELLDGSCVVSVPVRHLGEVASMRELLAHARAGKLALYKSTQWREHLEADGIAAGYSREPHPTRIDLDDLWRETDTADDDEGLYVKVEQDGIVTGRMKWVRPGFVQTITDSGSHWDSRAHVPNRLVDADILWDAAARHSAQPFVHDRLNR